MRVWNKHSRVSLVFTCTLSENVINIIINHYTSTHIPLAWFVKYKSEELTFEGVNSTITCAETEVLGFPSISWKSLVICQKLQKFVGSLGPLRVGSRNVCFRNVRWICQMGTKKHYRIIMTFVNILLIGTMYKFLLKSQRCRETINAVPNDSKLKQRPLVNEMKFIM